MPTRKFPLDREFWQKVIDEHDTIIKANKALGCGERTISRYLAQLGLHFKKPTPLSDYSVDDLRELIIEHGGLHATGRFLKVTQAAISHRLTRAGLTYKDIIRDYQNEIAPEQRNPMLIEGDCVITADWHNPFVSLLWLDRVLYIGKTERIKQLAIAGDFFDMDRLSWWLRQAQAEDIAVKLNDELSFSEMILERLEEQFTKIYLLGGNHWQRLLRTITHSISDSKLLGLVGRKDDPRYRTSGLFNWTLLDNKIRITHPLKARKLDYTLARDISILHPKQWILVAHRHRANEGFTPDGRPMWEIGWMGDVERMRYIQHTDATYYNWINGFAVYKNGVVRNLTDFNYDWGKQ